MNNNNKWRWLCDAQHTLSKYWPWRENVTRCLCLFLFHQLTTKDWHAVPFTPVPQAVAWEPFREVIIMSSPSLHHLTDVDKGIVFFYPLCSSIYLFLWTDLVTTISHERLEQSRWSLQWIFTSPYWIL